MGSGGGRGGGGRGRGEKALLCMQSSYRGRLAHEFLSPFPDGCRDLLLGYFAMALLL